MAGCAQRISPTSVPYAEYSCSRLQARIDEVGAVRSDAMAEQDLSAGTMATRMVPIFGEALVLTKKSYNEGSQARAEEQLGILQRLWDQKRCSEEIYKANKAMVQQ